MSRMVDYCQKTCQFCGMTTLSNMTETVLDRFLLLSAVSVVGNFLLGTGNSRGKSLIFFSYTFLEITKKSHTKITKSKKNHIHKAPKITNH